MQVLELMQRTPAPRSRASMPRRSSSYARYMLMKRVRPPVRLISTPCSSDPMQGVVR